MKKRFFYAICVMVVATTVAVVSCQKEKEPQVEAEVPQADAQMQAEIDRIVGFKKQVETRKANPGMKSAETMTLDEAMNNIVDLFNVTYTEPMAYYTESERHEFTLNVALTADGKVLLDDVVAAYEQALANAREAYHGSTLPDKAYQRLMVTCTPQRDGTAELKFDGQYGTRTDQPLPPTPHVDGPFSVGDDWLCGGLYLGKCNNPSIPGSADEELTKQLYLKINNELPRVPEGCRLIFVRDREYTFSGPEYPGVYYTEDLDDTCIGWMYLNDYYAGEINNIYRILPERKEFSLTALYTFGRYYVASAVVSCENHENCHKHVTKVLYGCLGYVNNDEIGFEDL